jgi:hypothetical protein
MEATKPSNLEGNYKRVYPSKKKSPTFDRIRELLGKKAKSK